MRCWSHEHTSTQNARCEQTHFVWCKRSWGGPRKDKNPGCKSIQRRECMWGASAEPKTKKNTKKWRETHKMRCCSNARMCSIWKWMFITWCAETEETKNSSAWPCQVWHAYKPCFLIQDYGRAQHRGYRVLYDCMCAVCTSTGRESFIQI